MIYYVDQQAIQTGAGTKEQPFLTISEAAAIAKAGDQIIIMPGIYEEWINPANGGEEDAPIAYRAYKPGTVTVTGAMKAKGWEAFDGDVWMLTIDNKIFGEYNPYTTIIHGDWISESNPVHTGEIYLNNKSFYEKQTLEEVMDPTVYGYSWDQDQTLYCWFTEQDEEHDTTILYANFQGADPNEEEVEINVRRRCFFPDRTGINYITISGIAFEKAATQWAPPTAFQDGMVGPHWSKGWVIEDCEISNSKCSGISLGKYLQLENDNKWSTWGYKDGTQTERDNICQAVNEGWSKETIGSHIVRNCHIHHCGQTGIVGHLGGVFSTIENNHIHNINNKQDLAGAEIGGIKMHAAIDVTYKNNHIHHCTRGLWLDWQAQGTRVTGNLFHDNCPPEGTQFGNDVLAIGEDIFVEVSHGPTLIDNNFLLSKASLRIPTQGVAIVHNFIAGSFTCVGKGVDNGTVNFPSPRYTPYHVPHDTKIAGFMTFLHGDIRFYNNIFVQQEIREDLETFAVEKSNGEQQYICGTIPYEAYPTFKEWKARFAANRPLSGIDRDRYYDHLPVWYEGNVYFNGAKPCSKENAIVKDEQVLWSLSKEDEKMIFTSNVFDFIGDITEELIDTQKLGWAFEPEQKFEDRDGKEIIFNKDYFGKKRKSILPGPLAKVSDTWALFDDHVAGKYPCPCCGCHTLNEGEGSYEICPVCGWEDDRVQKNDPEFQGGANEESLKEAKEILG
ncbi:MAG: right-handed parallel beta-helix repeat-containing protein [Lachnospiraceae bacterium]|nr:right-handed parallel beta-helix repeat-containing protein [Lachnospiraceae bacterium]